MKLKPYPKYKESGVQWIGKIPEEWVCTKVKRLVSFKIGGTPPTGRDELFNGENVWVTISDMNGQQIIYDSKQKLTDDALKICNVKKIDKGSLLFSFKLSVGFVAFAGTDLYTNEAIASFSKNNKINLDYFKYILGDNFDQNGFENIYGAKLFNTDLIKDAKFALPLKYELQSFIASFLDVKIQELDLLISKDRRLIELLKEKRVALINHVVTKGLDPNAKMKDSGIEWIGKIPETAKVMLFKRICYVNQGLQFPEAERLSEPKHNAKVYITIKWIHTNSLERINEYIPNPTKNVICKKDDVLMARTGATGEIITNQEGVFHNNFFKINYDRKKIVRNYLVYYLQLDSVKKILLLKAGVTTIPDLNHDSFLDTPIVIYSQTQQVEIADYLDRETARIDGVIERIEQKIEFLEEYKKSLIHHVVTGKVDVRGLVV